LPRVLDVDAVLFDAGGTLIRLDYRIHARVRAGAATTTSATSRSRAARRSVRREIDRRAAQTGGPRDRDADRVGDVLPAPCSRAPESRAPRR
jgi:hypothetical protein